jgi:hypothetical protein
MPANMTFDSHQRAQHANRIRRTLEETRTHARRAAQARRTNRQLDQQKNQLVATNSPLANVDIHRKTVYLWLLFGMLAVYCIDVVLFASVVEYFVNQSFAGSPWLADIARFLVPAAIVVIEHVLSIHRDSAHREHLDGFGSSHRFWAWSILSAFCALVMPMAVIAIFMAGEGDDFTPWVSVPLLITLAGLSLVGHILMLFGGRLAMESKSWAIFQAQMRPLQARLRQSDQTYTRHSQIAADRFTSYLHDLEEYGPIYPNAPIQPGPFDRDTREVVNEVHGYDAIRMPGAPPAAPMQANAPAAPPDNPPQNPPQENQTDWRTTYEREVRDQETEVRP